MPKPMVITVSLKAGGLGKTKVVLLCVSSSHIWCREGLEDLTGGVTSELFAADILDKDKFWADELMNVNKVFLFGLAQMGGKYGERSGIIEKHAYSIMEAKELDNFRLLKIRYTFLPVTKLRTRNRVSASVNSTHDGALKVTIAYFWSLTKT